MRTRLIALSVIAALWAGSVQASPIIGQVVGTVALTLLSNALTKKPPKLASCTLYDRDGNPVTVSCPADVAAAANRTTIAPAPAPAAVAAAPLPDLGEGRVVAVASGRHAPYPAADPANGRIVSVVPEPRGPDRCIVCDIPVPVATLPAPPPPAHHYAPPPELAGGPPHDCGCEVAEIAPPPPPVRHYAPPPPSDCGCEHEAPPPVHYREEYRDESVYAPRPVASFLAATSEEHSETTYRRLGVVAEYEIHESGYGAGYASSYGYGYGGVGYGAAGYSDGGYAVAIHDAPYPYGGTRYSSGGYAPPAYPARVAGRDPEGFLTWPGKR